MKTKEIWLDGKFVKWEDAKIHVMTHALHYGSGVFEGIRAYKTEKGSAVFRLQDHLKRLFKSAAAYEIEIPFSEKELESAVLEAVRRNGLDACYIRPIAFRGMKGISLASFDYPVQVAIAVLNLKPYLGSAAVAEGVRCKISSWRKISNDMLPASAKACGQYVNSILACSEAVRAGYDEALLLDSEGFVVEGSGENVFFVKGEQIFTPPASGILAGITRDSVIKIAKDEGYGVVEKRFLPKELFSADEVFMTGTAAEVILVRDIDGRKMGNGKRGKITEQLQKIFFEAARGNKKEYLKWLSFV